MSSVKTGPLPEQSLLNRFDDRGSYTDCFYSDVSSPVSLAEFGLTFYTTSLFRLERWILKKAINKPSSDEQASEVLQGRGKEFAAWSVEDREPDQILMCDFRNRTRHWFLVDRLDEHRTRLYFGSAVVFSNSAGSGEKAIFHGLLWFHKIYSYALLYFAIRKLQSNI